MYLLNNNWGQSRIIFANIGIKHVNGPMQHALEPSRRALLSKIQGLLLMKIQAIKQVLDAQGFNVLGATKERAARCTIRRQVFQ